MPPSCVDVAQKPVYGMVVVLADHRWHHGAKTHFRLFWKKPQQNQNKRRCNRDLEEADSQPSPSTPETIKSANQQQRPAVIKLTSQVEILTFQRHHINQLASVFQEGRLGKKHFVVHSMRAGLPNGVGCIILRTVIVLFVSAVSKQWRNV